MPVRFIQIEADDEGQRLDNYLFRTCKGIPKSRIYKAIRSGEVRMDKKRVKAETRLIAGATLRLPPLRQAEPNTPKSLPTKQWQPRIEQAILYEDDSLVVLNKPAGIAVHGGSGLAFGLVELMQAMHQRWHKIELVHRLDKDTSGVLMLAKKRSLLKYLHDQLRSGNVEKRYHAIVKGYWLNQAKAVELPLLRYENKNGERMVKVSAEGKAAKTIFTPLQHIGHRLTLVEAELITGRTHQIRVHCQACGHPIIGDSKYGNDKSNEATQKAGFSRMFLHAAYLKVQLPEKTLEIEAPVPGDFLNLLQHKS